MRFSTSAIIAGLRDILDKVAHTPDADRRRSPRIRTSLPIKVIDDRTGPVNAELVDISEGGAWFRFDLEPGIGDRGILQCAGFDADIPYHVRARDNDTLHVEFELGDQREAYLAWFRSSFEAGGAIPVRKLMK
ncbi:PilZ domain-containing protein [Bradyrhizobium oligotrophicum]|uniref:PilZ domain-containing protein n=1 Tax=Bradyrhizobium oligotrophicum TaxID=44255 RepID=UPI003EC148D6